MKHELSNETHCVSLDIDRRRRRKGAEVDDSVRPQGKRRPVESTQTEELEIYPC